MNLIFVGDGAIPHTPRYSRHKELVGEAFWLSWFEVALALIEVWLFAGLVSILINV